MKVEINKILEVYDGCKASPITVGCAADFPGVRLSTNGSAVDCWGEVDLTMPLDVAKAVASSILEIVKHEEQTENRG